MADDNNIYKKKDSARLVWNTKPGRAPNPRDMEFQTAEVMIPNPHRDESRIPFSFRAGLLGEEELDKQKMNRLIRGDNLLAMQALLARGYEEKMNLIYIDPPFDSKADYSHKMVIEGNEFTKEPSVIEQLAYKDTWAGGTDSYLDMLYPRLQLMKRLLAEEGSIYVHCDWHINSYVRILLDEIFGKKNFRNEIVWCYRTMQTVKSGWAKKHDIIFYYSKSKNPIFNLKDVLEPYPEDYQERFKYTDEQGRRFMIRGKGGPFGVGQGDISIEDEKKHPRFTYRQYMKKGSIPKDWWKIEMLNSNSRERVGFDTQKPESLLERIIKASSNEGDLVADFFCGSGTTLAVAEKLGRCWIGCELGKVGIQVTRARLVEVGAKPFLIENIGNGPREMLYLAAGRVPERQHRLKLNKPEIKDLGKGKVRIKVGIKRYVLRDIPANHTSKKGQNNYNKLMKLAKDNFAVLIDYWAIDWDFDGFTFKSQWQAFRGNGKRAKTVPIMVTATLDKKKRKIAVKVVDIFGNDAGAVIDV